MSTCIFHIEVKPFIPWLVCIPDLKATLPLLHFYIQPCNEASRYSIRGHKSWLLAESGHGRLRPASGWKSEPRLWRELHLRSPRSERSTRRQSRTRRSAVNQVKTTYLGNQDVSAQYALVKCSILSPRWGQSASTLAAWPRNDVTRCLHC